MNLVQRLNQAIAEFVTQSENLALKPATGSYSTPFRGSLFGEYLASAVDEALPKNPRPVLWLGSNPNCPSSQKFIEKSPECQGDWPDFVRQIESDEFGHLELRSDGKHRRWDPIRHPDSAGGSSFGWQFYATALKASLGSLNAVALANIYPWGSGSFGAIRKSLKQGSSANEGLYGRTIGFAQSQLEIMLNTLQPRLVIAPKSLVSDQITARLSIAPRRLQNRREIAIQGSRGRRFRLISGTTERGTPCPVLVLNHPSSLRFVAKLDRPAIHDGIVEAVSQQIDSV